MNRHLLSKNSGRGNVLMNIYACEFGRKTLRALESRRAGLTACLDLTTSEEHVFRKGDFYVIEPAAIRLHRPQLPGVTGPRVIAQEPIGTFTKGVPSVPSDAPVARESEKSRSRSQGQCFTPPFYHLPFRASLIPLPSYESQ